MAEIVVSKRAYLISWIVLMLLTGLTAGVSFINLGAWSGPVAMIIASIKALLVAMIFMHLRYEKQKIVLAFAVGGVFWLSILIVLSMADYISRGFLAVPGK